VKITPVRVVLYKELKLGVMSNYHIKTLCPNLWNPPAHPPSSPHVGGWRVQRNAAEGI